MSFWQTARDLEAAGTPFVVVTMLASRGHAPQDPGSKIIATVEGLRAGTVGGGKVEAKCIGRAKELLAAEGATPPEVVTWNLQRDVGMSCGGEATFLFETHKSQGWKIVVFGAGHVAQSVVRGLALLDCHVTCVDPREEWIDRLPQGERLKAVRVTQYGEWLEQTKGDEYFVVMTQGHTTDLPLLDALLKRYPDAAYVGAIGSKVKAIKLRKELAERGVSAEAIAKLRCPIGLPFGSNHPGEIAISVLGELIQIRESRQGSKAEEQPEPL